MTDSQRPTEASPLLQVEEVHQPESPKSLAQRPIVLLLSIFILCLAAEGALLTVPTTKLLEDVLCQIHYGEGGDGVATMDRRRCKIDSIQSKLAYLLGAQSSIDSIVGMMIALPYGILADKIGRRPVLLLSVAGVILKESWSFLVLRFWQQIPVYLILASPIFQLIGGGSGITVAMIYAVVADSVTEATRSNMFLRLAVSSYLGAVLGALVSARIMQSASPWIPILIALITTLTGSSVIFFIPETLHTNQSRSCEIISSEDGESSKPSNSTLSALKLHWRESTARYSRSFALINSSSIFFILTAFTSAIPVAQSVGQFYVQYISKRFGWTLAHTGYLMSIRGITSILVMLVILPALKGLMQGPGHPHRLSSVRKDLLLAQWSATCLSIGAFLMAGISIPIVVVGEITLTMGNGLIPLCRSVLTSIVGSDNISTLFTLINMVETIGGWCAGPTLAWLFSQGMKLKGLWEGLPYLGLSLLSTLICVMLYQVKLPPQRQGRIEEEEDNGE